MRYNPTRIVATLILLSLACTLPLHAAPSGKKDAAPDDARMEWWREARFGMFIHWGLYAVPAGEWKGKTNHAEWIRTTAQIPLETYNEFLPQFNPVKFDAEAWAKAAHDAGMKYVVITSKHHDGFCLWPSALTDFDVEGTPFKRDILKELKAACDKEGIRFCTYHSIMDWHHPDYLPRRKWEQTRSTEGADYARYVAYMKGQLKEIMEQYDPAVMWFDGEWEGTWTHAMGQELYDHLREMDPDLIINNRVDKGRRGMEGMSKGAEYAGDFGTPEQRIPAKGLPGVDWESCMTMNHHWGWNKNDAGWKSSDDLVRKLVDIASKGGNFLLNIGPKADGTFPQESINRLAAMGRWMDLNSEAIYGTVASPFGTVPFGRVTAKPGEKKLFLHVFEWPKDRVLELPGLANRIARVHLLVDPDTALEHSSPEEGLLRIRVPEQPPTAPSSVVVVEYVGELAAVPYVPMVKANADGTFELKAAQAEVTDPIRYEAARDCLGYWTGMAKATWLIDHKKAGAYRVFITQACTAADAGTAYTVRVGKQELKATAKATGDWTKFKKLDLGVVRLAAPGRVEVVVSPDQAPSFAVMNLRSLQLVPVNSP
ncbi:MAG: alpha-L-fucosidase [Verrucomicrobia bacterium]|nr:alpha-L-fucosidase [Verrucomicrobiota bacterium]